MAIYIKIGSSQFKLPNRIVLGRGAPFSVFDDDHSISRAHTLLVRRKDGVYVKDLGSASGTSLLGHKLPKRKPTKWNVGEPLLVGDQSVELLLTANEADCIVVKNLEGGRRGEKFIVNIVLLFMFVVVFGGLFISSLHDSRKLLFTTFFALVTFGTWYVCTRFLMKLLTPKNLTPETVFLSEEGFTAHYTSGDSMTFKHSNIDAWKIYLGGPWVRMENGEIYSFAHMKDKQKLVDYLTNYVPEKQDKHVLFSSKYAVFYMLAGTFLIAKILPSKLINGPYVMGVMVLSLVVTLLMNFKKNKKSWAIQNRFYTQKKKSYLEVGMCLLALAICYQLPNDHEEALAQQKFCDFKSKVSCKYIDYSALKKEEIDRSKIELACSSGNKQACSYFDTKKGRSIANE